MKIIKDFIPLGQPNRPGRKNTKEYITIHETGNRNKGADGDNHAAYLKSDAAGTTSWHYTVDDGENIYQHLPDDEVGYHAGDGAYGPGNCTSIGIEICVNPDGNFEKAKENAAWLVRYLRDEHGIPQHKVVQHNKWTGKNCPQTIRETGTWDDFLAMCEIKGMGASVWAVKSWEKAVQKGIFDGTNPQGALTREQAAVVLDRLGLLD